MFNSHKFRFSFVKDFIFMNYLKPKMFQNPENDQKILVTGGTSGLGLELVRHFLGEGFSVVATGRQQVALQESQDRFVLFIVDFSDLKQVAAVTKNICRDHSIRYIVNNAGILSPPGYQETTDGFEYTFQINFLAHLLINEIVLNGFVDGRQIRIASITSPVYRFASLNPEIRSASEEYSSISCYSSSKLYLAMMMEFLTDRHRDLNLQCFSFDPGTFSSGIYRMQKKWFQAMYRVAAPFMKDPARVAKVLMELLLNDSIVNGMIYDTSKRRRSLPQMVESAKTAFTDSCYAIIDPFLI
jgi:NAD(P)-dependent dehydrogenase (short-subunit alcohol dehydrogenase family)